MKIWLAEVAQNVTSFGARASGETYSMWPLLLKTGVALAMVVGLIFVFSAGLRRFRWGGLRTGATVINIRETKPLGARKMLCLIEVRGQEILLGITPDRITTLSHVGPSKKSPSFTQVLEHQSPDTSP